MNKKRIRKYDPRPVDRLKTKIVQRQRRYKIKAFALEYKGRKMYFLWI